MHDCLSAIVWVITWKAPDIIVHAKAVLTEFLRKIHRTSKLKLIVFLVHEIQCRFNDLESYYFLHTKDGGWQSG